MRRRVAAIAMVVSLSGCSLLSGTDVNRLDPPGDAGVTARDAREPGIDAVSPTPPTPPTPPGPPAPPTPPGPPPPPPPTPPTPPPPHPDFPTDCPSTLLFEPFDEPQCSATTRRCVFECREPGCGERCIAADGNPNCARCTQNAFIGCARITGCGDVFNRYVCCLEINGCLDDPSRCPGACDETDPNPCFESVSEICFPTVLECFRGGSSGGGGGG